MVDNSGGFPPQEVVEVYVNVEKEYDNEPYIDDHEELAGGGVIFELEVSAQGALNPR